MAENEDTDSGQKIHNEVVRQQWVTKLYGLYSDQAPSDCSIKIGGVTLPAHKAVLMSRSPAFRTMFLNPGAESESGVLKIDDFKKPEAMVALLHYCYEGRLDNATMDEKGMAETFKMADKYSMDELKTLLETYFIEKHPSVGNVVSMAILADSHSAEKLKKACIKLIAEEGKLVYESAAWKELKEANPKLTTDLAEGAATVLAKKLVKSELAKKDADEKLVQSELAVDRARKDADELRKKQAGTGPHYPYYTPTIA